MMKLSTLWSLDRTVDPATGRNPVVERIASAWDHDPGTVRFFRSSANSVYTVERAGQRAYLRLSPGSERPGQAIRAEIDLLQWLHQSGEPVVQPLATAAGERVVSSQTGLGTVHAVLFDALPGAMRSLESLTPDDMRQWGATVGRLHAAMRRAPERFGERHTPWQFKLDDGATWPGTLPDVVRSECHRLQNLLAGLPASPDTVGPIHGDLELDNLTWTSEGVSVLDFDGYGRGWYLLDIAKALSDPLKEGDTTASPRISAFIDGYREEHPLDADLLRHLPDFLALSTLTDYMSLVRAVDLEPSDAGATWMRELIEHLERWMRTYERELEARD